MRPIYVVEDVDLRLKDEEREEEKSSRHKITVLLNARMTLMHVLFKDEEQGCYFRFKVPRQTLRQMSKTGRRAWMEKRLQHYY